MGKKIANSKAALMLAVFASSITFLDSNTVNIAVPAMVEELGGGIATGQWILNAYMLSLGASILTAGALGDKYGQVRVVLLGTIVFTITSMFIIFTNSLEIIILLRFIQGFAGALLVPSAMAIIKQNYEPDALSKAIASWVAFTSVVFLIGPFLSGILVDLFSWKYIFAINLIPCIVVIFLVWRFSYREVHEKSQKINWVNSFCSFLSLIGIVYALIEFPRKGMSLSVISAILLGLVAFMFFFFLEKKTKNTLIPYTIFRNRNCLYVNLVTIFYFGGLLMVQLSLIMYMQGVLYWSAIQSSFLLFPVTLIMLFFSRFSSRMLNKIGARTVLLLSTFLTICSFFFFLFIPDKPNYFIHILPGLIFYGFGLVLMTTPMSSVLLASVGPKFSSRASALNNGLSRIAAMITISTIGFFTGSKISALGLHKIIIFAIILVIISFVLVIIGINSKLENSEKNNY